MKYRRRIYYNSAQRAEIWDRWQRGDDQEKRLKYWHTSPEGRCHHEAISSLQGPKKLELLSRANT